MLLVDTGRLGVQSWLYYPDSNSVLAGADRVWERSWLLPRVRELVRGTPDYPGFHEDDWEGVFVRLDPDGTAWMRASSHGHLQGCKWRACHDRWARDTGWVRISRGSHAGHVPFRSERRRRSGARPAAPRYLPCRPRRAARRCCRVATWTSAPPPAKASAWSRSSRSIMATYRPHDPGVKPPWDKGAYDATPTQMAPERSALGGPPLM